MSTGYYLLDHPNPHASKSGDGPYQFHGYLASRETKRNVVHHTAETSPTVSSADAVASYLSRTDRAASYQTLYDSNGPVRCIPWDGVAYGVRNFNTPAIHLSAATRAIYWGKEPAWDRATIEFIAEDMARAERDYGIPLQRVSAGAARAGARGHVTHAEMDPTRRSDPGAGYPWRDLWALAKGAELEPRLLRLTDPHMRGGDVLDWQNDLIAWDASALPEWGADGDFGDESDAWTRQFQQWAGISSDGVVGPTTRAKMEEALRPTSFDKHYDIAVLATPSDVLEDVRAVLGFEHGYFIHHCDPSHDTHHVGNLIVVGGPALRSIRNPKQYDRITELVGETRNDTWRKAFSWMAANPITDLKAREAARQ